VATIVDAGANIGTASMYFLENFPNARVFSIEPDPGNFSMMAKNVGSYGSRAVPICRALWPTNEELTLKYGVFRDGGEWSTQVSSEKSTQGNKVSGVSVTELMNEYSLTEIDILKIDIEGAEKHIFNSSSAEWIAKVHCIAIELHDEECRQNFKDAIRPFGGTVIQLGEVTIWRQSPHFATSEGVK
jgi:FkbM family methyltransferase